MPSAWAGDPEDWARKDCACGAPTLTRCHELWPHEGLVPCSLPLCKVGCAQHRHESGTMGFVRWEKMSADYVKDVPDGPGVLEWLKSVWRTLTWSRAKRANRVWLGFMADVVAPPPAPLPEHFFLNFGGGEVWESKGLKMVKREEPAALFEEGTRE